MVAVTAATASLDARTLGRDERADLVDAARIENVARLNPASTRRADPEPHLPSQRIGPVTIAVDHNRDACGRGTPGHGTVHVEMSGCAVNFHRCTRDRCRGE